MSARALENTVFPSRPPVSGFWTWDVKSDRVVGSSGLSEYFGFCEEQAARGLPVDAYIRRIVAADRDRIRSAIALAIEGKKRFCEVYKVKTKLRGVRTIRAIGRCQYDADGQPAGFPGWFVEVSGENVTADAEALQFAAYYIQQAQKIARTTGKASVDYLLGNVLVEVEREQLWVPNIQRLKD